MKDQHEQISGYRGLDQGEIDDMNHIKALSDDIRFFVRNLKDTPAYDHRCVAIALTKLEEAEMWACRAVARPVNREGAA